MNDAARTRTFGLIMVAFGLWAAAIGTHAVDIAPSKDVPRWIVGVMGGVFAFAGMSIVLRASFSSPETRPPMAILLAQWMCATAPAALLTGVCAWVAFGPGPRHFRSRGVFAFLPQDPQAAEASGRMGFGFAAALLALIAVAMFVAGLRRLVRR